jgi:hypothetical protein
VAMDRIRLAPGCKIGGSAYAELMLPGR